MFKLFIYLAWAEHFTVKKFKKLHYSPLYSSDKGYDVKVLKPQALTEEYKLLFPNNLPFHYCT